MQPVAGDGLANNAASSADSFSVAILGAYPPPYGGVSVHIKRLHARLRAAGIASTVYCPPWRQDGPKGPLNEGVIANRFLHWQMWLLQHGLRCRADLIHSHMAWYWSPALAAMVLRRKRVVVTIHDEMTCGQLETAPRFSRPAARWLMRNNRVWWIAVSAAVRDQALRVGVPAERLRMIPAYMPPVVSPERPAELPPSVREFIQSHSPLLSVYGWRLWLDADGCDLYGFDMCIDLIGSLKNRYPNVGLVLCIPRVDMENYYAELQRRVAACGIGQHVLFLREPLGEAYPLWQASDVYLRPTTTDGDAVAIREALSLGVPVVASDAVRRPAGTVLFPSRDAAAFAGAVLHVLEQKREYVEALSQVRMPDNYNDVLAVYRMALAS